MENPVANPKKKRMGKRIVVGGTQLYPGGHAENKGSHQIMEDTCAIIGEVVGPNSQYYGVFDGHGGQDVSVFLANTVHEQIRAEYRKEQSLTETLQNVISNVAEQALAKWAGQGSTLAIALIVDQHYAVANVGDTRIVLIQNDTTHRLTIDHRACDPNEAVRIEAGNGIVIDNRVNGVLAVSRAIGDRMLSPAVSAEPYIAEGDIVQGSKLIIACDGVWDVVSDEEAAQLFIEAETPTIAANAIMNEAIRRGSNDDITVICVDLTPRV